MSNKLTKFNDLRHLLDRELDGDDLGSLKPDRRRVLLDYAFTVGRQEIKRALAPAGGATWRPAGRSTALGESDCARGSGWPRIPRCCADPG
jgi:hypothetical protein